MFEVTWEMVRRQVDRLAEELRGSVESVAGVPRGGMVPAALLADRLMVPFVPLSTANGATVIVDDLVDSGATRDRVGTQHPGSRLVALFAKPGSPTPGLAEVVGDGDWLVFPWEDADEQGGPTDAVRRLLQFVGEDPARDGLIDTPARVVKAWAEMTAGYRQDPASVLCRTFDVPYDEMVVVRAVPFVSLCEHHVLPFTGTCTIGYVPGDRVVGLSKLARLVDVFARRLQVQERLTSQIAEAIERHLAPEGVGVVVRAEHSCMACRGVSKKAEMVTSVLLGVMRSVPEARAEFLALERERP